MDAHDFRRAIVAKREGGRLDGETWHALVQAYLGNLVDDAPMAALLMACLWRGLDREEAAAMTRAFVESGETLDMPDPRTVDKHSSGGVADTASLIAVPLVAACNVPVAKLSGRALGHTGGTLDKLESIPGVRVDFDTREFMEIVADVGCAIAAQSAQLVPADKRIYALRDRTGTVASNGLIAASIVSKKIAGGAHGIVFDVKAGRGAFVPDPAQARELAQTLVDIASAFGRRALALVTDMNEPLGPAIGNGLEAIEAREFLSGRRRDPRLDTVVRALGEAMLGVAGEPNRARERIEYALESGEAYGAFEAMLRVQGMHPRALEQLRPHARAAELAASRAGVLAGIDTVALGEAARDLIEHSGPYAGIVVHARTGERLEARSPLATVYGDCDDATRARITALFEIGDEAVPSRPLVYGEVRSGEGAASGTRA